MAYLWSDKVTDFYYSNPESDTVAVLWTDPDSNVTREHYILVDEADEQWRDFVTEAMMANDAIGSAELKTLSTLLIKNSAGTTLKTCHTAGA